MLVSKTKLTSSNEKAPVVCLSDGQSNKEQSVNICSNEQSSTTCTSNIVDKCQTDKNAHMQPVKPTVVMQSSRPAVPIQQIVSHEDDKNGQSSNLMNQWVLTRTVKKIKISISSQ